MIKRLHYIQHVPFETPGSIIGWANANSVSLSATHVYHDELFPDPDEFDLLVIMGGPMGIHDEAKYGWLKPEKDFINAAIEANKPVVGICLGAQLVANVLGASVRKNKYKEIGWYPVNVTMENGSIDVTRSLPRDFTAFHWHGDTFDLPTGAVRIASSEACRNQGFVYRHHVIGLQFHLEVTENALIEMVKNGRHELNVDQFVQPPQSIIDNREHISTNNEYMSRIMTNLAKDLCDNRSSSQQP